MSNVINVGWMYPDILNLHGERANAKALELIAKKMGIKINIDRIDDIEKEIDFNKYDILLFNSGQLKEIEIISNSLRKQKKSLDDYIKENKIILLTGTTGALFSNNVYRIGGYSFQGLNILDMDVNERDSVIGDDLYFLADKMKIIGSQIQMIDINLRKVKPFGKIKYGYGNNGTMIEGARYKNVIFTNCLGPVLVKNPWFTEYLIKLCIKNKGIKIKYKETNYDLEKRSLESTKEFINKKVQQ